MALSVFHIFSSKYMRTQSNENKKKLIQLEVMVISLLESIPEMITKIVEYDNKKSVKLRVNIAHKNIISLEPEEESSTNEADLFNSFNDSAGSYFNNDDNSSFKEPTSDLEQIKKCEGDICKNIETIIDCINQSQHEYSLVGGVNQSKTVSNSTIGNTYWKKMITFFIILLLISFLSIPLYCIFKEI